MVPSPENIKAFRHARWRLKSTSYLLAMHESSAGKGSLSWLQQHADLVNRARPG